jgi:hypothetical protein
MLCRNGRGHAVNCNAKGYLRDGKFFYTEKRHNHDPVSKKVLLVDGHPFVQDIQLILTKSGEFFKCGKYTTILHTRARSGVICGKTNFTTRTTPPSTATMWMQ